MHDAFVEVGPGGYQCLGVNARWNDGGELKALVLLQGLVQRKRDLKYVISTAKGTAKTSSLTFVCTMSCSQVVRLYFSVQSAPFNLSRMSSGSVSETPSAVK